MPLRVEYRRHSDVTTTRRYARSELEDRRAALEALDH